MSRTKMRNVKRPIFLFIKTFIFNHPTFSAHSNNLFDIARRKVEIDPDVGCAQYRTSVTYDTCPCCGSEYFSEVVECIGCNHLVSPEYVTGGYCLSCIRILERQASNILKRELSREAYNAIREHLELPEGDDGCPSF